MRKLLLIILFAAGTATTGFGQTKELPKFSINFEAGKPIGEAGRYYSSILGGSVKYQMPIIEDGAFFTASAGYNRIYTDAGYRNTVVDNSYGFIPVKAGVKDYLYRGLYTGVEVGATFATTVGFGTKFAYAVGTGYSFSHIEIGIRYEGWLSETDPINQLGAHLGFRF